MADHRDESGESCKLHAPVSIDALMALATIGSRMPGFHHDCASKLQSLMMSLDEISELAGEEARAAAESASVALRELHGLFTQNRALAKSPQLTRGQLKDLLAKAADRAGVKILGEVAATEIEVSPPAMTHALAVLFDLVAGPAQLVRAVDVSVASDGAHTVITLRGPANANAKQPPNASELLAIASFVVARDGGELRCRNGGESYIIKLLAAH